MSVACFTCIVKYCLFFDIFWMMPNWSKLLETLENVVPETLLDFENVFLARKTCFCRLLILAKKCSNPYICNVWSEGHKPVLIRNGKRRYFLSYLGLLLVCFARVSRLLGLCIAPARLAYRDYLPCVSRLLALRIGTARFAWALPGVCFGMFLLCLGCAGIWSILDWFLDEFWLIFRPIVIPCLVVGCWFLVIGGLLAHQSIKP